MADEEIENWAWNTWADELNAALHPLGIWLSGVDAATVLEPLKAHSLLETVRTATEDDVLQLTDAANRFCETDKIAPSHINEAIERMKWHYQNR